MSLGLILIIAFFVVPYVGMNAWRLARGKRWAITPCHALMEADRAAAARRREAREAAVSGPASARPPERERATR